MAIRGFKSYVLITSHLCAWALAHHCCICMCTEKRRLEPLIHFTQGLSNMVTCIDMQDLKPQKSGEMRVQSSR